MFNSGQDRNTHRTATFSKTSPNAVVPDKGERVTDAAYDIEIIGRHENRAEDMFQECNVFTTGLQLKPAPGQFILITAAPSLYKTGYTLMDSPIIINSSDTGELLVPLYKFRETDDLELPYPALRCISFNFVQYAPFIDALGGKPVRNRMPEFVHNADYADEDDLDIKPMRRQASRSTVTRTAAAPNRRGPVESTSRNNFMS